MSTIDCLILAPAIPAIPVFVTWYLPWERWIPWKKLPKAVVGPYALYLFFVAFHFDDNRRYWWLYYGWLAIAGVVVSIMAVVEKVEGRAEKKAGERKASTLGRKIPISLPPVLNDRYPLLTKSYTALCSQAVRPENYSRN
jgi:hypothetical protein